MKQEFEVAIVRKKEEVKVLRTIISQIIRHEQV